MLSQTKIDNNFFLDRICIDNNGCWNWKKYINKGGYGVINIMGSNYSSHRVSYVLYINDIVDDICVCHKCDNRKCINPNHLFLGTYQDNISDMIGKGRRKDTKHENNGRALLTKDDVINIRLNYKPRIITAKILAKKYNVSEYTIRAIIYNKIWKI